ncbi:MAG TPA: thiamine pyrophosphate-binding protein [Lichenihabitans sp.]|jgi:acetolactate synthase-1/2/3 large subunit|nr:thiamine pyrophosphate-binding protein [Lichenihabitans sp.]
MPDRDARTGGQILVDQLRIQGVDHVFCVPGESYLAVLDALHEAPIALTVCRHEAGAAMMADAAARLTNRPGICMVTRGPGATNAAHGIHIAEHDSVPLILFVGQIERSMRGRGAFQEMDYRAVFGSTAKWVTEIDDAARIPEIVSRAFHVAMQGRPGPVVIALPEDMLTERATVADAVRVEPTLAWPGLGQMAELQKLLWASLRPMLVLGGGGWTAKARAATQRFAERFALPVATSFRRASLFDAGHPNYAGEIGIGPNPKLKARIAEADLLILAGARMAEMPSQSYTLLDIPNPRQTLVQVHAGEGEIGRVYHPALGIQAAPSCFAATLESLQPPNEVPWREATTRARAEYLDWTGTAPPAPGPVNMAEIVLWLRDRLPRDAIVTNGAGNYAIWPGRFHRFRDWGTQLAPTSGSMGYGVPAAIGAKRLYPERTVVAFAGDGCFLMTSQEFATAVQYGLAVVVVVVDNGMYGTIRMHQERTYPGRVTATALNNPDFAAFARAFGGHGDRVETTADFAPAYERALASGKPAILHVRVDPDAITPATTLSALRAAGRTQ